MKTLTRFSTMLILGPVHAYRLFVSPILPRTCRYHPTCSAYAIEAVKKHGARLGGLFALRRFLRCHPWGSGGYDPVPEKDPR